jgi:hypothetical protein
MDQAAQWHVLRSWGETITRDAFAVVCSGLAFVIILPDNGRDAKRS